MARLVVTLLWGALLLLAAAPAPAAPPPVEVSGATYAEFDPSAGVWILRGAPVVITRGEVRLEAAQVRYAERTGTVLAAGGVVVRYQEITLTADEAEGRLAERFVAARGRVTVTERRPEGEARLTAARLEAHLERRRIEASGGPVLTHREGTLRGERLAYDWGAQSAVVTGEAVLAVPEGTLEAGRIVADLAREEAEASGGVRLASRQIVATAPAGRLDRRAGSARLTGGVQVRRGGDVLTAETVTVDLRTGRVVATGSPRLLIAAPEGN